VNGTHTLHGTLRYQACNDQVCTAPTSIPFTLEVTVSGGAATGAAATVTPAGAAKTGMPTGGPGGVDSSALAAGTDTAG